MDFNKDGYPDLLVGDTEGNIIYYKGNRTLSFEPGESLKLEDGTVIWYEGSITIHVSSEDWNGDGLSDLLIVPSKTGMIFTKYPIYYYENVGTIREPLFKEPVKVSTSSGTVIMESKGSAAIGDIDGDNLKDLVTSSCYGELTFYKNIGTKEIPELAEGELVTVWSKNIKELFVRSYIGTTALSEYQDLYNDNKCWIYGGRKSFCSVNIVDYNFDGENDILFGFGGIGQKGIVQDLNMNYYPNFVSVLLASSPVSNSVMSSEQIKNDLKYQINNNGVFTLKNLRPESSATIKIFNLSGACLFNKCLKVDDQNIITFNLSEEIKLSSGVYVINVISDNITTNLNWINR